MKISRGAQLDPWSRFGFFIAAGYFIEIQPMFATFEAPISMPVAANASEVETRREFIAKRRQCLLRLRNRA